VDDKNENLESVVMSDDGTGGGLRIPAVLISKSDGGVLKDYLLNSPAAAKSQVALSVSFMVPHKTKRVDLQMWYTADDDRSLDLLRDIGEYIRPLVDGGLTVPNTVRFKPRFVHYACEMCDADIKREYCVSNGQYCLM
jgi:hypothetical protein